MFLSPLKITPAANLVKAFERNYTTLDGVADYYTIPTVTLTGDFVLSTDVVINDISSIRAFAGLVSTSTNAWRLLTSGSSDLRIGNYLITFTTSFTISGKLSNVGIRKEGNNFILFQDDVDLETITDATAGGNTFSFDSLGIRNGLNFFKDVISNVLIYDAGTLIRYYKIDEDFSTTTVLKNSATTLGSEEVTNGDFSGGVTIGWTAITSALSVVDGKLRVENNAALYGKAEQVLTTIIGMTYKLTITGYNGTGDAYVRAGHTTTATNLLANTPINGTFTFLFTAITTTTYLSINNSSNVSGIYSEFDNISVKQADGYGEAISISSSELFTLEGNDWLGSELIVNGNFATDSDWTKQTGWTIGGGVANCDGTQTGNTRIIQAIASVDDLIYQTVFTTVITAGNVNIVVGGATAGTTRSSSGTYIENIADGGSDFNTLLKGDVNFVGTIDNVSVKRILQAPLTAQEILTDGSTVLWVDATQNVTKNGSDLVSLWGDKSGNGNDLVQATETNRPLWSADGILFDGVDNFMKAAAFTLVQPEFIYIVFKQVTWTNGDYILDGNGTNVGYLRQLGVTPELQAYAWTASANDSNLSLNTYGIARVQFNGASSTFQINENTQITGNFGAANMGGFTLGSRGDNSTFGNIEVKEVIVRNTDDDTYKNGTIYNYLADKYGI